MFSVFIRITIIFLVFINLLRKNCLFRTIYETPTIYGLIWGTPRILVDSLMRTELKSLKNGTIDEIFELMVNEENIPVKFYFDVKVGQEPFIF